MTQNPDKCALSLGCDQHDFPSSISKHFARPTACAHMDDPHSCKRIPRTVPESHNGEYRVRIYLIKHLDLLKILVLAFFTS